MVAFSDSSRGQTAADTFSSAATGGATNPGGFGNNGGGGDNNDPYQGFVQASQPRGLSAIERAVQNTVQRTKDFLSNPVNKRGIIGSLIGGALLGPFGAFLGGSLGQRYGGNVSSFFQGPETNTDDTEIEMLTRAGLIPNQFTMPMDKPNIPILTDGGITNINIPNFDPNMNLYADVSQKDLDLNKARGSKMLDLDTFRDITGNPTLTQEELDAIRDGTITAPTGKFVV
mgnify:CR=1 FL=1